MKRHFIELVISCGLFLFTAVQVYAAATVSSSELIAHAGQYNGQTVLYSGEVIGDVMARGDHAWINLYDGKNAIGVWVSLDLANKIRHTGSYRSLGDKIEIAGVFNRACVEHGADLDIHGQGLRIISEGRQLSHLFDINKRNSVVILLGVIFILWILTLFLRR
jgi:hypothetical protein